MKRRLLFVLIVALLSIPIIGSAETVLPFESQVYRQTADLMMKDVVVGSADFWNTRDNFMTELQLDEGWEIRTVQVYAGADRPQFYKKKDKPIPGRFPCKENLKTLQNQVTVSCSLEDIDFSWGRDRTQYIAIHADTVMRNEKGKVVDKGSVWAYFGPTAEQWRHSKWGWFFTTEFFHPDSGHFIDAPVAGLTYATPTNSGTTDMNGKFDFFPGEEVNLWVGSVYLGKAVAELKISPLDIFMADLEDSQVINMARLLQTLDADGDPRGGIHIKPSVTGCLDMAMGELGLLSLDFADDAMVQAVIDETLYYCMGNPEAVLVEVSAADAKDNLENGISESGIYRKNISKTEDWGEDKQKLEVMPVYFPGVRSDGTPSYCDMNDNNYYDEEDQLGVPYEEWRLNGDPLGEECDPRVEPDACVVTLIECREVAKPLVVTYLEKIDIFDDNVTTEFYPDRFAFDTVTAISRDDGTTWKRMNVSRMADLSSFDLETGEPFPGTTRAPQLKVNDNQILVVWVSSFARGGNPRYAITTCDNPETEEVETPETGCQIICRGDPDQDTEVCEPDYPYDDEYFIEDIWGVRGHQGSVNYDEVDDVAELGIGEIPYSALWAARGVIVTQKDLDEGKFDSMIREDDPETEEDESAELVVGDIVWFKPERLTSGRRDAFIPVVGSARGSGFAIAWQEDPDGLRPGKGKGPGEGWSGAISNHKTDIWYSFVSFEDFSVVDENFVPGGPPEDGGPDEKPGLGRPKALVPFSLPVRISDNDMLNTDTLKVVLGEDGLPEIDGETGTYTPIDPLDVENGNANGTKRYAYLAKTDPLYEYYWDNLDLCDTTGTNGVIDTLPGTAAHERWYQFTNVEGSEKTVCISSDGRLIDGDVSASRPNISLQPYTKPDGTKSAWVLLAYEESKGMGHSLAAGEHEDDDLLIDSSSSDPDSGQDKPDKQDLGKNVIYHSFDYTQPELVSAGHMINLPALCGGLYPTYCTDETNPTCTCEEGTPVPLYFETQNEDGTWTPDESNFLQFRTEIARRTRFIAQSYGRMNTGTTRTAAAIIYKQGQEGQGRPADVFIRRIVVPEGINPKVDNPYAFENFQCTTYLDETFDLPACPTDGGVGYSCNIWGEASGDRLCGGIFTDPLGSYERRDHVNLTSADVDYSVDAGPEDDTPDDPTDDVYGTDKVLLWSQHIYNLGDESYGHYSNVTNTETSMAGMFSNARSHRGFIRGDFLVTAYAFSPNWSAARNGNDRYNFYIRKSFDGGQTWTTTPGDMDGVGVYTCTEWRSDPTIPDDDGTGNAPPVFEGFDPECDICPERTEDGTCIPTESAVFIPAGEFQPGYNVSQIANNKETSSDPRVGATPPVYPLDGRDATLPVLRFVEDEYLDNIFFVAWGTGDNVKSSGGTSITPEAAPLDVYYTRSLNYGDTFLKVPWEVSGENSNYAGEVVWRYERMAWGEPEQGECQLRATSDGSKMYGIYHQLTPVEGDPDEEITRWYPWEPEETHEDDLWFRRVIFWNEELLGEE